MAEHSIYRDIAERTGGDIYDWGGGTRPIRQIHLYQTVHGSPLSCPTWATDTHVTGHGTRCRSRRRAKQS